MTLYFFGNTELVGHLPIYGAMLVLLVYGSDPQSAPVRVGALALDPTAPRHGEGTTRGHADATLALRLITDPEGQDPRTTTRPERPILMA